MRFPYRCIPTALIACGSLAAAAIGQVPATKQAPKTYKVAVTVVDAKGKPVPGLTVATLWHMGSKTMEPMEWAAKAVTDNKGLANLTIKGQYAAILAYDKSMTMGGQTAVDATKTSRVKLQLAPLATLKTTVDVERGEGIEPPMWSLMALGDGFGTSAMYGEVDGAKTQLRLPAGKYGLGIFSMETNSFDKNIELKPGQVLDIGTIKLELTALAKSYGKEAPPIKVTEARGMDKPFNLAEYKGKWVVLEFWGFW
jgi:hypothetical protein